MSYPLTEALETVNEMQVSDSDAPDEFSFSFDIAGYPFTYHVTTRMPCPPDEYGDTVLASHVDYGYRRRSHGSWSPCDRGHTLFDGDLRAALSNIGWRQTHLDQLEVPIKTEQGDFFLEPLAEDLPERLTFSVMGLEAAIGMGFWFVEDRPRINELYSVATSEHDYTDALSDVMNTLSSFDNDPLVDIVADNPWMSEARVYEPPEAEFGWHGE